MTGQETTAEYTELTNTVRFRLVISIPGISNVPSAEAMRCSHFIPITAYSSDNEHMYISAGIVFLFILKSRLTEVSETSARAWIANQFANGTPITIYCQLATPLALTPAVAPLTALPQLDRITPRQNVLTATTGNVELTYAKSLIKESDEIRAAMAL